MKYKLNILVVGSGGREHAIIHKLSQSPRANKLFCAPGNGGTSKLAQNLGIDAMDMSGIAEAVEKNKIDIVFVAPDNPLAAGMVDYLEKEGIKTFGPKKNASEIEWSKVFSKGLMKKYGIPTAEYEAFDNFDGAKKYVVGGIKYPMWIKSDGLAFGKGAIRAADATEAIEVLKYIMKDKAFGESGDKIIIEEELAGQEITVLAFCDGKTVRPMISSQDHKKVFDGDRGPNTGGMGAFAPASVYTPEDAEYCMQNIYMPTVNALRKENRVYKGVIYFGLMKTADGIKVIEYNARFGDPETQVILPLLKTDLVDIMIAVMDERLDEISIEWENEAAVCVAAASGGYPGKYETGFEITGYNEACENGVYMYHAGTKMKDGKLLTAGGRVIGVTARSSDVKSAALKSYEAIKKIHFEGMHYRSDIGVK